MEMFERIKPYIPITCLGLLIIIFGVAIFFVKSGSLQIPFQPKPTDSAGSPSATRNGFPSLPPVASTDTPIPLRVTPARAATPNPTTSVRPTITPTIKPTPTVASQSAGATFSGTIEFTGQAPVNSRIVVFQKVTGTSNYQLAIDNLVPYNTSAWMWDSGTIGESYDLIAILKQKQSNATDLDLATSNVITSTATTSGVFTLTYATTLLAPSPNISVTCSSYDANSQTWQTLVSFQTVTGAASYWFEVGTTDGGSELTTFTQNATSGANQIITLPFQNGTTYYARYAYAGVPNVTVGSSQLSPLSTSVQLRCSQ